MSRAFDPALLGNIPKSLHVWRGESGESCLRISKAFSAFSCHYHWEMNFSVEDIGIEVKSSEILKETSSHPQIL